MKIKYIGNSDVRRIYDHEFEEAGQTHASVEWAPDNAHIADMDAEVGKWLVALDPEFIEITKKEANEIQSAIDPIEIGEAAVIAENSGDQP